MDWPHDYQAPPSMGFSRQEYTGVGCHCLLYKTWYILLTCSVFFNIYFLRASLVVQMVKNLPAMQGTQVWSVGWEAPLKKRMAIHSSVLPWRIPWTEEPSGLWSMGSQRVRHDWAWAHLFICLCQVLVATCRIFFFNCDVRTLSCSVQTQFSALEAPSDCLLPLTSFPWVLQLTYSPASPLNGQASYSSSGTI